jgi:hypothetical protein
MFGVLCDKNWCQNGREHLFLFSMTFGVLALTEVVHKWKGIFVFGLTQNLPEIYA